MTQSPKLWVCLTDELSILWISFTSHQFLLGGPYKMPYDGGLPCNVVNLIKKHATFFFFDK